MTNKDDDETECDPRLAALLAVHLVGKILDEAYVIAKAAQDSGSPWLYISRLKDIRSQSMGDSDSYTDPNTKSAGDNTIEQVINDVATSTPQKVAEETKSDKNDSSFIGQGDVVDLEMKQSSQNNSTSTYINNLFDMSEVERVLFDETENLVKESDITLTNESSTVVPIFLGNVNKNPDNSDTDKDQSNVVTESSESQSTEYSSRSLSTDAMGVSAVNDVAFYIDNDVTPETDKDGEDDTNISASNDLGTKKSETIQLEKSELLVEEFDEKEIFEPVASEIVNKEPGTSEIENQGPVASEMVNKELFSSEMVIKEPFSSELVNKEPFSVEMVNREPMASEVVNKEQVTSKMVNNEPGTSKIIEAEIYERKETVEAEQDEIKLCDDEAEKVKRNNENSFYENAYLTLNRDYEQCSEDECDPILQDPKSSTLQEVILVSSHSSAEDIMARGDEAIKKHELASTSAVTATTTSSRKSTFSERFRIHGSRLLGCLRGFWRRRAPRKRMGLRRTGSVRSVTCALSPSARHRMMMDPKCPSTAAGRPEWKFNTVNEGMISSRYPIPEEFGTEEEKSDLL